MKGSVTDNTLIFQIKNAIITCSIYLNLWICIISNLGSNPSLSMNISSKLFIFKYNFIK